MKFERFTGSIADLRCDLVTVPVFEDGLREGEPFATLDRRLDGLLSRLADEEQFKGKKGQSLQVHTHGKVGPQRVLLAGMGARAEVQVADLKHLAARGARAARNIAARTVAVVVPSGMDDERASSAAAEGTLLGRYRFDRYLSSEDSKRPDTLETVQIAGGVENREAFTRAIARATAVAKAVSRARDLINEPAGEMTPRRMAEEAQTVATAHGLELRVHGPNECREMGMGMYLAVAQGSDEEPRFIHLTYRPRGKAARKVCLIGKGVTFDSGGLSLKPSNAMEDMKVDMSGAAAVISAIGALAELGVPYEIHAIAACTENMPSGKAYKLGDVLRSMSGKTVEINNTDAEGRLTLGDAITYALQKVEPDEIFDFATLTGACVVALGPHTAGVMGNDPRLLERWLGAARVAGEDMWHLPLPERLKEQLKSEIADMKNTGERYGGALTAGLFLREFVGKTPWVHVDIAGPATADKDWGTHAKGGVGFAVATIIEYLSSPPSSP